MKFRNMKTIGIPSMPDGVHSGFYILDPKTEKKIYNAVICVKDNEIVAYRDGDIKDKDGWIWKKQ